MRLLGVVVGRLGVRLRFVLALLDLLLGALALIVGTERAADLVEIRFFSLGHGSQR